MKKAKKKNRFEKMRDAKALCVCGSDDYVIGGKYSGNFRKFFFCRRCDAMWSSGNDGLPFSDFALEDWRDTEKEVLPYG